MVKIRLTRIGKKGEAHYRIIAVKAREKRDTKAIEQLGFYNPGTNPSTFEVDKDRIKYWLSVGAQPTYTVARLLEKAGLYKSFKKKFNKKAGKKKKDQAAAKEAKKATEVVKAPAAKVEEVKTETK
jgi:small subunit ribosomal protein S16